MSDIRSTVIDYALQNENNLEVAFETYKAYNEICDKLSKDFLYKLKERLEKTLSDDNWIFPDITSSNKITFLIKNKTWTEPTAFGLNDFNDNDRACFAAQTNEENKSKLFANLQKEIQGRITGFGWWAHLIQPYNKWNESLDGLKSIFKPDHLLDYTELQIIKIANIIDEHFKATTEQNAA